MISPPVGVHTRPVATPGRSMRSATSWKWRRLPSAARTRRTSTALRIFLPTAMSATARRIEIVVAKVLVLLRVEDLEQGGRRIAAPVGADLVDLVEHEDRVIGLGAADRLDDAAWHRADVGAAVAADLRLVVHPAKGRARELAPHRAGYRMSQRRLAHAGRADEAEDWLAPALGDAAVLAQLPHGEVLDDALLHLVEVVVVVVEDRARLGH